MKKDRLVSLFLWRELSDDEDRRSPPFRRRARDQFSCRYVLECLVVHGVQRRAILQADRLHPRYRADALHVRCWDAFSTDEGRKRVIGVMAAILANLHTRMTCFSQ
jgi:hypothetical protein